MPTVMATVVPILVFLAAIVISARRFARRQRERGRWDQYGPLEETEAPRSLFSPIRGGGMIERLEVLGLWKRKVLRQRRPGEKS